MAYREVSENLFDIKADTVIVTINLVGAMGAGVAKTARDTIPGLYSHYKKMYPKISPTQFITYKPNDVRYILIPTKLDWKNPSPRDLVVNNINRLVVLSQRHNLGTIAIPPMGCGNGGLDFENDIRFVYLSLMPFVSSDFVASIW